MRSELVDGDVSSESASLDSSARPGENDRSSCPLCRFTTGDRTDVYVHLMTAHRKSRISEELLTHVATETAQTGSDWTTRSARDLSSSDDDCRRETHVIEWYIDIGGEMYR